ncbi:hypothetical protein CHELA1G11_11170 [Hyphomicrobiales bacterium]|nr:hypothetical protein CHELA1G11_11170 [Hyphomicrobiales bacterium]CAH1669638.1 hypothetical protein CHELA1G2_13139 [Hyphomicrobiales bacterium]
MTNTDKERADFEAWFRVAYPERTPAHYYLARYYFGEYARAYTAHAYKGYIAGREAERAEAVTDEKPAAYLHQHATGGPCLSFLPSDAHEQEQGWIDTPLYPREAKPEPSPDADHLHIFYTNYRGESGERRIIPISVRWGSTEWHPRPQWLLRAMDVDKGEEREFAMSDIGGPSEPSPDVEATCRVAKILERCGFTSVDMDDIASEIVATLSKPEGK